MAKESVIIYQLRDKYGNRYSDLIPQKVIARDIPIRHRKRKRKYRPRSQRFEKRFGPIIRGQCKRFTCDNPGGMFSNWYCSEECFHWDYPTHNKTRINRILQKRGLPTLKSDNPTILDRPICRRCREHKLTLLERRSGKPSLSHWDGMIRTWICFACQKDKADSLMREGFRSTLSPYDGFPYRRF